MCKDISLSTYITNAFLISWGHFLNFLKNNLKKFCTTKKSKQKLTPNNAKKLFFILISFESISFNTNKEII